MTSIKPLLIPLFVILSALTAAVPTFAQNPAHMSPSSDQGAVQGNKGNDTTVKERPTTTRPAPIVIQPQQCKTRCLYVNGRRTSCYQVCF